MSHPPLYLIFAVTVVTVCVMGHCTQLCADYLSAIRSRSIAFVPGLLSCILCNKCARTRFVLFGINVLLWSVYTKTRSGSTAPINLRWTINSSDRPNQIIKYKVDIRRSNRNGSGVRGRKCEFVVMDGMKEFNIFVLLL